MENKRYKPVYRIKKCPVCRGIFEYLDRNPICCDKCRGKVLKRLIEIENEINQWMEDGR